MVPEIRAVTRTAAPSAHFVSFFFLAFASWVALTAMPRRLVVAGLIGFALLTEVFQLIVPGRCCDAVDMLHNLAGLTLGIGLGMLVCPRARARSRATPASPCVDPPGGAETAS
jgi:VanZ family protein